MNASDILSIISLVVAASSLVMNFYLHIEASRLRRHLKEVETRFHDLEFEMRDELEREKKRYEELIEEVKREKNEWVASSEAFKEIQSLLDLIDRVFVDEPESKSHRLECKKAIFNRVVSKLDEKEHA